ncbi:pickpocket protein 28-like [Achroia grisella]|uniref:pickpocket protein 28-like n=1 Tax=Achroia grisella TaxID=688607 RepID=UPI0027D2D385|nr:pickpocket protein 28-like [Achroia grisella]
MEQNIPQANTKNVLWKQRRKRQKGLVKSLLLDYAKNTTLHGLRYVTQKGLSIAEKLFWLLTFTLSVALCFYLISNVWMKWQSSPVIVSFSEKFVPVEMVPFPSVTICPDIKNRASAYNYSEEISKYNNNYIHNNLSADIMRAMEKIQDIALICNIQQIYPRFNLNRDAGNVTIIKNLLEVSPSASKYIFNCNWRGDIDCSEMFSTVLTEHGVCFNFNSLAANEILREQNIQKEYNYSDASTPSKGWSLDTGYSKDRLPYPRRGVNSGSVYDLTVILQMPKEDPDETCNGGIKGSKIFVQHPADHPQSSLYYYASLPGQVSSVALKFSMMSTSKSLENYSPEVRQCYFQNERHLRYFKIYTSRNCRLECQANYTLEKCGCVWFHMPHNDSASICTIEKLDCVEETVEQFADEIIEDFVENEPDPCSCLPTCNAISYDAEILKTDFNFNSVIKQVEKKYDLNLSELIDKYDYSQIDIHFKEPRFASMRRSELFGLTDFLANCGGLLGLFLGFSALSLIEIIYFFTIRLGFILKKDLDQEKNTLNKDRVVDVMDTNTERR